jgi:sporulation protein YlmC with PRC-barrel domain
VRTLSSFLSRTVATESGRHIGRCRDLRGDLTASKLTVTGLVVGGRGRLEHFGFRRPKRPDCIPWEAIVRIDGKRIVVRDGTELE